MTNADGSRQRNLTRNPASDYSPAWSPDGRRIAFASARADPTGNDLWLIDADGAHPRPLVRSANAASTSTRCGRPTVEEC